MPAREPKSTKLGWREWLGLAQNSEIAPASHPVALAAAESPIPGSTHEQSLHELTQRELWLPAKRRLLAQVADLLIDHDLEILPFTLSIAYDCVTGGSPNLAQQILERTEKGLPVTLRWLEDTHSAQARDAYAEAVATLVGQLEVTMSHLGRTMAGVRDATGTYSTALEGHVADLRSAGAQTHATDNGLIDRLTTLTRKMLTHARTVETGMVQSETQIEALTTRLNAARHLANQDHLTGLPNRRAFDELYDREAREATMSGETLCVAFCDIDHFKRVNDTHGHPAGDRVIRYVAETLGRIADARCHVARHGGEEFAILLRGATLADAWARLDAAREEMAQKRLINRANDMPFGRITFSGGIADAMAFRTKRDALKAADEALYAAKDGGRNRILIAGDLPEPLRVVA